MLAASATSCAGGGCCGAPLTCNASGLPPLSVRIIALRVPGATLGAQAVSVGSKLVTFAGVTAADGATDATGGVDACATGGVEIFALAAIGVTVTVVGDVALLTAASIGGTATR